MKLGLLLWEKRTEPEGSLENIDSHKLPSQIEMVQSNLVSSPIRKKTVYSFDLNLELQSMISMRSGCQGIIKPPKSSGNWFLGGSNP